MGLLNRFLFEDTAPDRFVTLFYLRLDPKARSIEYASAGHEAGYVLDASGFLRRTLRSTGYALGMFEHTEYPLVPRLYLAPGDTIVLLSDGLTEARTSGSCRLRPKRSARVLRGPDLPDAPTVSPTHAPARKSCHLGRTQS